MTSFLGALIQMMYCFWYHNTARAEVSGCMSLSLEIVIVDRVLLINFVIKCAIWTVVLPRDCSNGLSPITSQFIM